MVSDTTMMIVGPSGSGKTSLLGALKIASDRTLDIDGSAAFSEGYECRLNPTNANMEELIEIANDYFWTQGKLADSSDRVLNYQFQFSVNLDRDLLNGLLSKALWIVGDPGEWHAHFEIPDGPGGAIFPIPGRGAICTPEDRESIFESARKASGLILCLDSTDNKDETVAALIKELPVFCRGFKNGLPFKRMAIILTKTDQYFWKQLPNNLPDAERRAKEDCPWKRVREIIPDDIFKDLVKHASNTELVCGWVSAFGFNPDGTPNYDPTGCMGSFKKYPLGQRRNHWHPFQLMDPLFFLLTGEPGALKPYRTK